MLQYNPTVSGSLTITGSLTVTNGVIGTVSGVDVQIFSSSINQVISGIQSSTESSDARLTFIETFTSSALTRLTNIESKSASVDISISNINTFTSSNANTSLNSKTGSYATTGSNSFYGTQVFSGSVYIANDLIVQGSSSIQYISASSVSIGTNIVQLNTANPSVRFAGLTIIDSGSIGGSGSFLYDSVHDEFVFVHRGNGTNVTSSHFVLGPETFDNLGNETYLTCNILTKGTGKEHLVDSCIFDNGTTTCIKNNLIGTGTISGTTIYGSTNVCSPVGLFSGCIGIGIANPSANLDINATGGLGGWTGIRLKTGTSSVQSLSMGQVTAGNGAWIGTAQYNQGGYWQTEGTAAAVLNFESDGTFRISTNSGLTTNTNYNITERLRITSTGTVGIGTDAPVTHASAPGLVVKGVGARGIIEVWDGTCGKAVFQQVGGTTYIGNLDKGTSGGSLRLLVNGSGTSATEAVVITCGANVGIGTCIPKSYSSLTTQGQIISLNNIGIDYGQSYRLNNYYNSGTGTDRTISSGYAASIGLDQSGGAMVFYMSTTCTSADNNITTKERIRLTCNGTVLINNSGGYVDYSRVTISGTCNKNQTPGIGGSILHLTSCETDYPFGLKFNIVGDTCNCLRTMQLQTGDHGLTNQGNITFQHAGGGILMGTSTSSGIGILNTYKAPVSSNYVDQIVVQGTGNYPSLRLGTYDAYDGVIATTGNDLRILSGLNVTTENHNIMFYTSFNGGTTGAQNYERMRVRYDGNVGIGTASPYAKLTVAGTIGNPSTVGGDVFTIDTMNGYQTIANGGYVDFTGMSGFLMVNNWSNGATTLFAMGGGNTAVVGTVTGTAGTTHHSPGVGGYRWCNNYGSTANFGFQVFRTRNTA